MNEKMSLPSWERGLKSDVDSQLIMFRRVAPLVGARIEIGSFTIITVFSPVAPLVGARIEI